MNVVNEEAYDGIKSRIVWIIDVINRFDLAYYTDQQVIELRQAIRAYNTILGQYPADVLAAMRDAGVDYTNFSLGKLREAQMFIYNYDTKFNASAKTPKI